MSEVRQAQKRYVFLSQISNVIFAIAGRAEATDKLRGLYTRCVKHYDENVVNN